MQAMFLSEKLKNKRSIIIGSVHKKDPQKKLSFEGLFGF